MKQIADKIFYVGVNDRNKERFESLWPLPHGVSYNSFILCGDKVALVDTVDSRFFPRYIAELKEVLGDKKVDYLIVNHMEPDHSGSISLVRSFFPDVCLVGNAKTLQMIEGYYGEAGNTLCVAEGTDLDLGGGLHLKFMLTPMIHWPETMMTLETTTHTLFSGDAFGCFGALDGGVLDTEIGTAKFRYEMIRYYSNIVGKYGLQVQMAFKKLAGVEIRRICSTHGPVWTEKMPEVLDMYNRLSLYQGGKGVCLVYGSMYGNTGRMAEAVAEGLVQGGLKDFAMHKLSRTDSSYLIADAFKYRGLVLGAPTYNNCLFPLMADFIRDLEARSLKNRLVSVFGSFTWAGQAVKKLREFATHPGMEQVGEPVEMKQGFSAEAAVRCQELG